MGMDSRDGYSNREGAAADARAGHPAMSIEAGPSRCHMESSFYNILHTSGFAEWAARAEAQNEKLRAGSWGKPDRHAAPSTSSSPPSTVKSSRESSSSSSAASSHRSSKKTSQRRKSKDPDAKASKSRSGRSKRTDDVAEEDEEDHGVCYGNYTSMDAELTILSKHLMARGGGY
ncbi:hypothetical protein CDD83_10632 [Cordyceps sp. RAO-2017]|nr:hypothetical protein CDD83_10632 [Cordyceps sp. RAO-2017]